MEAARPSVPALLAAPTTGPFLTLTPPAPRWHPSEHVSHGFGHGTCIHTEESPP